MKTGLDGMDGSPGGVKYKACHRKQKIAKPSFFKKSYVELMVVEKLWRNKEEVLDFG